MRQEERGGIYLAMVRNSKPSTEVTASLDYHSRNFLARQSTHLAYGHHDCNVGDCPRQEAGQGQGENITEEVGPQQLLWRENRDVGRGEGKCCVKKQKYISK